MATAGRQLFKVFVGNLPWTIGSQELRQFGSSFGPVHHAVVVFDKNTGLSRGFGFIHFATKEAQSSALTQGAGSQVLEGNNINIQTTSTF